MAERHPYTPTAFEVYCQRCRVTFPVGTRTCLHCGGRLARERQARSGLAVPQEELDPEAVLAEEELPVRRALSPFTAIWVLLAIAATLYRACTAGG
jgi:ribosomal protein L37E